jgi:hypothetical protein
MAKESATGRDGGLRKLLLPAAAGIAGSAVAVALTKKPKQIADAVPRQLGEVVPKVRDAMPQLPEGGIGEITDDLRGRLDSVLGRDGEDDDSIGGFEGQTPKQFDASKFETRRAERRERREQRRRRAA